MGVRAKCRECGFTWTRDAWQHCVVDGCHATFASTHAGDMHRIGSYTDTADPRRCRTAEELTAGGMWQTEDTVWHGEWSTTGKQRRWSGPNRVVGVPLDGAEGIPASPRQGEALGAPETALRPDAA